VTGPLSADEARRLDRFSIGTLQAAPSMQASGARVARTRGFGTEFHEFRQYEPGDDPRSIAWPVYARLGQLVTRVTRADAHMRVHVLMDTSRSMSMGRPSKLTCAVRLAALVAYVGLRERDAVGLATFDETVRHYLPPVAGRGQLFRVFRTLEDARCEGVSHLDAALRSYARVARGPGLAIVISDFFDAGGATTGLRQLLHQGLTPVLVHVCAPEELDPGVDDDIELVDVERPGLPVLVDRQTALAYRSRLTEHRAALGEFCRAHGLVSIDLVSSHSFRAVLDACRRSGLLRAVG
jgi:uncharacterized protein (DUF58 family)